MVIRTYLDKDNVIIYNDYINTGKNEISELFYGGTLGDETFSRLLFHFDENRIIEFNNNGFFCDNTKLTHTLRMTNTGAFDKDLIYNGTCDGKQRTCSFDLILFKIPQYWDEGNGYDYNYCGGLNNCNFINSSCPSNWKYSQTLIEWNEEGVYSALTSDMIIGTQHFEHGNENLSIDITTYIDSIMSGDTNYGLGLAFLPYLEHSESEHPKYVGFFSRHTNTFYEPYVETIYNNPINDDRNNFYLDKNNKLYLYVNVGGSPTMLDTQPIVTILDPSGDIYTSITATCVTKGVYMVDINIPSNPSYKDCMTFNDVWSNIYINGINRPDIELDFIVKDSFNYYNISSEDNPSQKYNVTITGINPNEVIKRGDIRRVNVNVRIPYTSNQKGVVEGLKYRLYVKEGNNEFTVIDYQDVNKGANNNYFYIDTYSLLPNNYYLDIKMLNNNEITTVTESVKFTIVSQVELRDSQ